jgi:hypothetical protein
MSCSISDDSEASGTTASPSITACALPVSRLLRAPETTATSLNSVTFMVVDVTWLDVSNSVVISASTSAA